MDKMSKAADTKRKRSPTRTSSFGSPGRAAHDSSPFYNKRLYEGLPPEEEARYLENEVPPEVLDTVLLKSSESMDELPDNSVHLMVTSPPYNVGKDYDEDLSLDEYLEFLGRVMAEVHRVLVPGGRAAINIANVGRKPYIPLNGLIAGLMDSLGFFMRGEIIWNKSASAGSSTAWGSWLAATNPTLRDVHEYILVFSKGAFRRENPRHRASTVSRDEFLEFTKSIWSFSTQAARTVGHPAPFPVELPYRLIQLFTFEREVVLDPFMGSGQTGIAALKAKRRYVGYEIDPGFKELADQRIGEFSAGLSEA